MRRLPAEPLPATPFTAAMDLGDDPTTNQYAPWSTDPDTPEESLIMSKDEIQAAAQKIAEAYPELVHKPDVKDCK